MEADLDLACLTFKAAIVVIAIVITTAYCLVFAYYIMVLVGANFQAKIQLLMVCFQMLSMKRVDPLIACLSIYPKLTQD